MNILKYTERTAESVNEFCAAIGISRTLFYAHRKRKLINTVHAGRRTLVPITEREAYLLRLAEENGK